MKHHEHHEIPHELFLMMHHAPPHAVLFFFAKQNPNFRELSKASRSPVQYIDIPLPLFMVLHGAHGPRGGPCTTMGHEENNLFFRKKNDFSETLRVRPFNTLINTTAVCCN